MPGPAAPQDVEARWRPLSTQEYENADTFLEDAWRLIKRRIPDVEARMADAATGTDFTADVVQVQAQAVLRVMKNPDGKRSESIDDYSWTRDRAVSAGLLYITDDEWTLLGFGGTSGAFSIDTMPTDYGTRPIYPVSVTGIPTDYDWS